MFTDPSRFIKDPLVRLWNDLWDFVYPGSCLLCSKRIEGGLPLCVSCRSSFEKDAELKSVSSPSDFPYLQDSLCLDRLWYFWEYDHRLEALIHRVKYQNGRRLGAWLGAVAGAVFRRELDEDWALIPVPLHRIRQRERGYNQSVEIGRGLGLVLNRPVNEDCLVRNRETATQTLLSAENRQENVHNAFSSPRKRVPAKILLIDDVVTTGATMNSCASVLKNKGAVLVEGFSLARPGLQQSNRSRFFLDI